MPLIFPKNIFKDNLKKFPIQHKWSDWDPYELIKLPESETKEQLKKVSNRGITAFSVACSEWVVFRMSNYVDDKIIYDYLEAFWVFLMGYDSAMPTETENDDWLGPIRGPIDLALMTSLNTIYLSEEGPPVQNSALSAQIALHVLPDPKPFIIWQEKMLKRLVRYFRRKEDEPTGDPVCREVIDPSMELDEKKIEALIKGFLEKADFTNNPFLSGIKSHDGPL
ncbi:MAG: hypothetical protein PVH87_19710 [Desulfobacteraceae bacterium]|jgi:hypothetical protein